VVGSIGQIVSNVAAAVTEAGAACECDRTMAHHVERYGLSDDWHEWLARDK